MIQNQWRGKQTGVSLGKWGNNRLLRDLQPPFKVEGKIMK